MEYQHKEYSEWCHRVPLNVRVEKFLPHLIQKGKSCKKRISSNYSCEFRKLALKARELSSVQRSVSVSVSVSDEALRCVYMPDSGHEMPDSAVRTRLQAELPPPL